MPIHLIVGLGNPGPQYEATRHNAGANWLVELASKWQVSLQHEKKFQAYLARFSHHQSQIFLMFPTTYMNESGVSVGQFARFHRILPESILVAHDELDLAAGVVRLKQAGGHGGHNGLRSLISHLQSPNFLRLRIGIGHPGDRNLVTNYVLSKPNKADDDLIAASFQRALEVMSLILEDKIQQAMNQLN